MAKQTFDERVIRGTYHVWLRRRELVLLLAAGNVYGWAATLTDPRNGAYVAAAVVLLPLLHSTVRRALGRYLYPGTVSNLWTRGVHDVGAHEPHTRARRRPSYVGPRVVGVTATPVGHVLDVEVPRGGSVAALEEHKDGLARCLDTKRDPVRELRIEPDRKHPARRARVTVVRRDPFEDGPSAAWPPLSDGLDDLSVWKPVHVGAAEDGAPMHLQIVGNHILVGGITGGGKSVFLRPLLATCALSTDPCALWLFDAKLTELAPWTSAAQEFIGRDGPRAIEVLKTLQIIAAQRQQEILNTRADKIRRSSGLPVHVIVVDELARYAELDQGREIIARLRDLAATGRALGISVIAASQDSHSDIVSTTLRNQFSTRIAFRCADRHHAGTILGQSDASALAAEISPDLPGVGYALGETGRYDRFRSVYVGRPDDSDPGRVDDVAMIVDRAAGRRVSLDLPVPAVTDGNGTPPIGGGGTGTGRKQRRTGKEKAAAGKPDVLEDVKAAAMEHLSQEPLTGGEIAGLLGRHPDDKTVRRALHALRDDGLIVRADRRRWVLVGDESGARDDA